MTRRLALICALGALIGLVLVELNPVQSTLQRLAFLGCIAGLWTAAIILSWKLKPVRLCLLALPVLLLTLLSLPGGELDREELRSDYLKRLTGFEDSSYHWGGESPRGIDCSGLPRRAFRDSLLSYGIRHLHGPALRAYLEQWWFDASAKALGRGYRDYTTPLQTSGSIDSMSYQQLRPGDLAITKDGIHALVYLGNENWIQADPGTSNVHTLNGRTDSNPWFTRPVSTHRWQLLAD